MTSINRYAGTGFFRLDESAKILVLCDVPQVIPATSANKIIF